MYIVIENQIHWNQIQCHVASNFIRLSFICSPWKVEDTDKNHKQLVAVQVTEHPVAFVITFTFLKGLIIKHFALELSNNATLNIWWQTKLFESVCACIYTFIVYLWLDVFSYGNYGLLWKNNRLLNIIIRIKTQII